MTNEMRSLCDIAKEIRNEWQSVNFAARPYLDAMGTLRTINSQYGYDNGRDIVAYFLANATSWRGEKARSIKKELNAMLKRA